MENIDDNTNEWLITLSEKEKKLLELAEKDIEQENLVSHEEVMEELKRYFLSRNNPTPQKPS